MFVLRCVFWRTWAKLCKGQRRSNTTPDEENGVIFPKPANETCHFSWSCKLRLLFVRNYWDVEILVSTSLENPDPWPWPSASIVCVPPSNKGKIRLHSKKALLRMYSSGQIQESSSINAIWWTTEGRWNPWVSLCSETWNVSGSCSAHTKFSLLEYCKHDEVIQIGCSMQ